MMTITARETETYAEALSLPAYGEFSPGEKYADLFASLASHGATVLDAGCGTGKGMIALASRGFSVTGCDLTEAGLVTEARTMHVHAGVSLWRPIPLRHLSGAWRKHAKLYDYVYCTDVLEHIPPQFTMLVVQRLLDAALNGVFLSICLVSDSMGGWVGHALHQSVRRYDEWLADLRELADVTDARDLGANATFMLRHKWAR
jgi:SAM-dependent methyltransferase